MYLPKYLHVVQCALTCRGWRITAQCIVFSSIRLDSTKQMNNIQHLASSNKMIGNWAKCLDISFVVNAYNKVKLQSVIEYLDSLINRSPASLRQIILNVFESERLFFSPTKQNSTIQSINNLRKLFLEVNSSRYVFVPGDQFLVYLIKRFPKLHQFFFHN
jgi:hypothetical protein